MVAGTIAVGGITRLTRSGLSMTDWSIQGGMPPRTTEEWEAEFQRYKQFPEFNQRQTMTLEEFKFIYHWEYGHRMLGRFLGVAFGLPALYFIARGRINKSLYPRLGLLFTLGGAQGLVGWWMVKSGLEMNPEQKNEIRVSPYRLTAHLAMAFTTFTLLVSTGFNVLNPIENCKKIASSLSPDVLNAAKKNRRFALHNLGLVFLTAMSGAFVAGNDAGRAFNTFPKMGDDWIPQEILDLKPTWKNFFENTATVQFDHRVLALSTLSAITYSYYKARSVLGGEFWKALPKSSRVGYNLMAGMAFTQVGLGISTLLHYVPLHLASAHQLGSVLLLTFTTFLASSLRFSKYGKAVAPAVTKAGESASKSINK